MTPTPGPSGSRKLAHDHDVEALDQLALEDYQYLHSTRGELLRREGREWRNPTRKQISRRDPMSRVAD